MSDRPSPDLSRRSFAEWFPFGVAPFVMLVLALGAGGYLLARPIPRSDADLSVWTFSSSHYKAYVAGIGRFERAHDVTVSVSQVHMSAVTTKLRAAFWAGVDVPDLVEVEITPTGTFFRGPIEDVGFVDLKPYLVRDGLLDRIVQSRLAPYTNRGRIFGIPHDVHPVMLAYRKDIFDAAGIDADELDTWDKFIAAGRKLTKPGERYMMQLEDAAGHSFEMFFYQRGGDYFDKEGNLTMDSEVAVDTLMWFVPLVAGPDAIAFNLGGSFGTQFYKGIASGFYLTVIAPDWRARNIEANVPELRGRLALMPLPAFEPGGRRTSSWGGTMLAITKQSPDPDKAWELAKHLYFDEDELGDRFRDTYIIPPFRDAWDKPQFQDKNEYYSGQRIGRMYLALADETPEQIGHPFLELAKSRMGEVVTASCAWYRTQWKPGDTDAQHRAALEAYIRQQLEEATDYVRLQIRRNPF